MARTLSVYERGLLERLVAANKQHIAAAVDLEKLKAEEIDEFGSLKFERGSSVETRQQKLSVEASLTDNDGVEVHALPLASSQRR